MSPKFCILTSWVETIVSSLPRAQDFKHLDLRGCVELSANAFIETLFGWWEDNQRADLPWRLTQDPYKIMVSEFALQQTQVSRVVPKYEAFIDAFPTVISLADASPAEVITLWQGLGYNRRALWLHQAAVHIAATADFTYSPEELIALKGIGDYTSRSIPIFAFNTDIAAIDTNIRRVLIYHKFATETTKPRELQTIADRLLPRGRSRDYHNALMDYGALYLTAKFTGIASVSRQPKFSGSKRELRGIIIRLLTERAHSKAELRKAAGRDCTAVIKDLERDGMIQIKGTTVSLQS